MLYYLKWGVNKNESENRCFIKCVERSQGDGFRRVIQWMLFEKLSLIRNNRCYETLHNKVQIQLVSIFTVARECKVAGSCINIKFLGFINFRFFFFFFTSQTHTCTISAVCTFVSTSGANTCVFRSGKTVLRYEPPAPRFPVPLLATYCVCYGFLLSTKNDDNNSMKADSFGAGLNLVR